MKRVNLDSASRAVKEFVRGLPIEGEGIELELEGKVVCEVLPPQNFSEEEKVALLERGRDVVRRVRQQAKDVSARSIERETAAASREVGSRHR